MNDAFCDVRDTAVFAVLQTHLPTDAAQALLCQWQRISSERGSIYDSIVTFVNSLDDTAAAGSAAWLRVLLIDAITQAQGHEPALA